MSRFLQLSSGTPSGFGFASCLNYSSTFATAILARCFKDDAVFMRCIDNAKPADVLIYIDKLVATPTRLIHVNTKLYCLVSCGVCPVVSLVSLQYFSFADFLLSICYQRIAIICRIKPITLYKLPTSIGCLVPLILLGHRRELVEVLLCLTL